MRFRKSFQLSFTAAAIAAIPANAGVTASSAVLTGTADASWPDPTTAIGPTSGDSTYGGLNPFNPAFDPSQIVMLDPGNTLTLQLSSPVPATGQNLGVFSSVGFVDQSGFGQASGTVGNGIAPQTFDQNDDGTNDYWRAIVSVSQDGIHYVPLSGGNLISLTNPSNAYLDEPINNDYQQLGSVSADEYKPFLGSIDDFSGKDYLQIKGTLDGSAGGTWLNLSGTGLTTINDVRFNVPANANYRAVIDAVSGSSGVPTIVVPATGSYSFNRNSGSGIGIVYVAGINIGSGATANVPLATPHENRSVVNVLAGTGLTIGQTNSALIGTLDLANNDAIIAPLPLATGGISTLTTATKAVAQGYANGRWTGPGGIISSAAATDSSHMTALGVIQNNQSGAPLYITFDGDTLGDGDILIKYTYYGDANLDGVVDGSDYSLIDSGYASDGQLTGWLNGDFNYDGVVDGSDYSLIDNAFNNQSANFSIDAQTAAKPARINVVVTVPEPALTAFAGLGCTLLFRRRDRRGD